MDDPGLSWQQHLGNIEQMILVAYVKRLVWKVKNSATGSSGGEKRGVVVAGRMATQGQKSCAVGANSWLAADWRRTVANRTAAAACADLWRQCQSDQ